ncbi:MAG: MarR family winged helix-turn-helix transcriptional regulator [Acidimicrobiales bacterium]
MSSDIGETDPGGRTQAAWRAVYRLVVEREGQRRHYDAAESAGVTPAVLKALLAVGEGEPLAMKELADRFRCDPSYVTSLVDGLEGAGLGERRVHPADRRVKVVALTPLGEQTYVQVRKVLDQPPTWFSALSDAELAELGRIVDKLLAAQAQGA